VFAGPAADPESRVAALKLPGGASLSRKQIDELHATSWASYGARGLAYIKVNKVAAGRDGLQSPIAEVPSMIRSTRSGRAARVGRRRPGAVRRGQGAGVNDAFMGALRVQAWPRPGLVEPGWKPLWVVDFPMFEWDAGEKRWTTRCTTRSRHRAMKTRRARSGAG
jgi:aspartyl-tRNA synthetase